MTLNNKAFLAGPTLFDQNPNKFRYYPSMVYIDRCGGNCNTFDDPFDVLCFANKHKIIV